MAKIKKKKQKLKKKFGSRKKNPVRKASAPLTLAIEHHQAGELDQAKKIYEKILTSEPNNPVANHFLGLVASENGEKELAVQLINRAISCAPEYAEAYNNLGIVLSDQKKNNSAIESYKKAIALKPGYAEAHYNLGNTFYNLKKYDEAISCYQKTVSISASHPDALNNLASALNEKKKFSEAIHYSKKALSFRNDFAEAYFNLGNALDGQLKYDEAIRNYRKALSFKPDYAEAHTCLGTALAEQDKLDQAIACYLKAISLKPDLDAAHNNLANVFKQQGNLKKAITSYQKALSLNPADAKNHSNLLLALNYSADFSQEDIFKESVKWAEEHAGKISRTAGNFLNTIEKEKKLRIGYLSPDFRRHSVAYFFEPLLEGHHKERVTVYCYSDVESPDQVTKRLQTKSDVWFDITGQTNEEVAQQIITDRIDILIDLAGHTAKNRLLVFAQKPAPIQVSWLGYPNTTGMKQVDYRITDEIADPRGQADKLHSEQLIRMENGFLCYQAAPSAPQVTERKYNQESKITFGSFNNISKITDETQDLWAEILKQLPNSRLLLKCKQLTNKGLQEKFRHTFEKKGIAADQIEICPWLPKTKNHLELYSKVDIGLDPFPYNGTTTTCEALWMGVPVITMMGDRHSGRVGASILTYLGMEELVAGSGEEYLEKAVGLAQNYDKMTYYRNNLRQILKNSPLSNADKFAEEMERNFRKMWHTWCDKEKA